MAFTIKTAENNNNHPEIRREKRHKRTHTRQLKKQGGNAMIYVLIALALFGGLTITLSNQNTQADGQNISDEQATFYAAELITYAASARQAVELLLASGSEIDDLDFINPTDAAFNTGSHADKIFHPLGGGLSYTPTLNPNIQNDASTAWVTNNNINVDWTPSTSNDGILTAYLIARPVCEALNRKITGSDVIPVTLSPHSDYFLPTSTKNLTIAECPGCEGYSSLCIANNTNDNYSFYDIIAAQ